MLTSKCEMNIHFLLDCYSPVKSKSSQCCSDVESLIAFSHHIVGTEIIATLHLSIPCISIWAHSIKWKCRRSLKGLWMLDHGCVLTLYHILVENHSNIALNWGRSIFYFLFLLSQSFLALSLEKSWEPDNFWEDSMLQYTKYSPLGDDSSHCGLVESGSLKMVLQSFLDL